MEIKTVKIFEYDDIVTSTESGNAFDEVVGDVEDISSYYFDFYVGIEAIDDDMTMREVRKTKARNFIATLLMNTYDVKHGETVLIKIEY